MTFHRRNVNDLVHSMSSVHDCTRANKNKAQHGTYLDLDKVKTPILNFGTFYISVGSRAQIITKLTFVGPAA